LTYLLNWPRPLGFLFFGTMGLACTLMARAHMPGGAQLRPRRALFRRISGLASVDVPRRLHCLCVPALYGTHFYMVYRIGRIHDISFFVMLCGTWIFCASTPNILYAAVAIPFVTALWRFCARKLG